MSIRMTKINCQDGDILTKIIEMSLSGGDAPAHYLVPFEDIDDETRESKVYVARLQCIVYERKQ